MTTLDSIIQKLPSLHLRTNVHNIDWNDSFKSVILEINIFTSFSFDHQGSDSM